MNGNECLSRDLISNMKPTPRVTEKLISTTYILIYYYMNDIIVNPITSFIIYKIGSKF